MSERTPKALTEEERAEALKVAGNILKLADEFCIKGEDLRRYPDGRTFTLYKQEQLKDTIFKDAKLLIQIYSFNYQGPITSVKEEAYALYEDHTDRLVRYSTSKRERFVTSGGNETSYYESMYSGKNKEKEADKEELESLYSNLEQSIPR